MPLNCLQNEISLQGKYFLIVDDGSEITAMLSEILSCYKARANLVADNIICSNRFQQIHCSLLSER